MSSRGYRDTCPPDCKVYVGNLTADASKEELEDAFSQYGRLRSVWVARNPPGFAFVEFEDPRDAEDGVRALDGRTLCGRRVRVELSSDRPRRRGPPPPRRGIHPEDRCYECGNRGHYARDCRNKGRGGGGGGGGGGRDRYSSSRSRSRSPRRSRSSRSSSRSRSRSPKRESRANGRT